MSESEFRVLVVGGGSIGERHVRCFQKTGRVEAMLCEIDDSTRERVCETYSLPFATNDLAAGLEENPGLVVICTPAHLHIVQALQTAEAGAHLLIEKPLSVAEGGEDGIDALVELVTERGLFASIEYI